MSAPRETIPSALHAACEWRKIERVPTIQWLGLRQRDGRQLKFLGFSEVGHFLETAGPNRSILHIGLRMGMRPSEFIEGEVIIRADPLVDRTRRSLTTVECASQLQHIQST